MWSSDAGHEAIKGDPLHRYRKRKLALKHELIKEKHKFKLLNNIFYKYIKLNVVKTIYF